MFCLFALSMPNWEGDEISCRFSAAFFFVHWRFFFPNNRSQSYLKMSFLVFLSTSLLLGRKNLELWQPLAVGWGSSHAWRRLVVA